MALIEHEVPVLVVGAGPAGLISALQLARQGVKCMLVERNLDTTKWPKMDITNCRSMELFRELGIAEGLREQGVAQDYSFDVLFSTGLSEGGEVIAKWDLPSPNAWREKIRQQNDGTMPREPYQRCSQAVFEAWLKPRLQTEPLIDSHFGMKFETLDETEDYVSSHLVETQTGTKHVVKSQYVIACDGAGSRVRRCLGIETIGGPVPGAMFLVHFKSRDLTALHKQGQFWHIFFSHGGVIISQDEVDTWTAHMSIGLDEKWEDLDPEATIREVLGGSIGPLPIKVDRILVKSAWRPNICIAEKYASEGNRVFLAGDAAHQNIPTGGYGMNTAVGDSFDIGWKLASVLQGHGGKFLLDSYEAERKPVALRNIERSGIHFKVHQEYWTWVRELGNNVVISSDERGQELRQKIRQHLLVHDGENKDHGIELGYRYEGSPVVFPDTDSSPPAWSDRNYVPTTWPGARAPHVFLSDGDTSIFDLLGPAYTLVDFSAEGVWAGRFREAAEELGLPLKVLHLPEERHVASIWERQAVLVRPDHHVSWRLSLDSRLEGSARTILEIATGRSPAPGIKGRLASANGDQGLSQVQQTGFSSTVGNEQHDSIRLMAEFQK